MHAFNAEDVSRAIKEEQKLEINREMEDLHRRLNTLDSALENLSCRLTSVMRDAEPNAEGGAVELDPLTPLGTMIRSATSRVEAHTDTVQNILRRLEIQ